MTGPGDPDDPWASGARAVSGEFAGGGAGPVPPPAAAPTSVPARYRLGEEIGVGGMGRVLRAWDHVLQREVAVKLVRSARAEVLQARLVREAEVTAGLEHPSIVPVYDAGVGADGVPWYAMRVVRGRSLHDALAAEPDLRGRLRWVRHVLAACEAMAYAHRRGVLHRDLKPANILVGDLGETQVMDWGLALRIGEVDAGADEVDDEDGRLTRAGSVVGSPAWMSPEQARGEPLTPASDVYSLGAVLFELLSGRPPHSGTSAQTMLAAAREGRAATSGVMDEAAPAELRAVVRKAMAPQAADRYASAAELAADLGAWLDGRAVSAHAYTPRELLLRLTYAWRVPLLVGGVGLILLATVLAISAVRLRRESHATAVAAELARDRFASLLAREARVASEEDDRVAAEVLAAEALLRQEDPDARGVLARYGFAARPRRLSSHPLPACDGPWLAAAGEVAVCPLSDAVEGWRVADGQRLWRYELPIAGTSPAFGGDAVIVTRLEAPYVGTEAHRLDAMTGALLGVRPWFQLGRVDAESARGDWIGRSRGGVYLFLADGRFRIGPTDHVVQHVLADGDTVLGWAEPGVLSRWDLEGHLLRTSPDNLEAVVELVRLDAHTLLACSLQGRLYVLDADTLGILRVQPSPVGGLRHVRVGPARELAFLGDGGVAVGRPDPYFAPETISVTAYADGAWSADGARLTLAGRTMDVFAVEVRGGVHARLEPEGLTTAAVSPSGDDVAVYGADGAAWRWSVSDGVVEPLAAPGATVVKHAAWSADGSVVAIALSPPSSVGVRLFDMPSRRYLPDTWAVGPTARVGPLAGGGWWAYPWDRHISTIDGQGRASEIPLAQLIVDAEPAGDDAFVLSTDDGALLWHEGGADRPFEEITRLDHLRSVDARDDGQLFLGADGEVIGVFDRSGARLASLTDTDMHVGDVALSPDGTLVAAGDVVGALRVWSLPDGVLRLRARGHTNRIGDVAFSDDGSSLYTASWDHSARRWQVAAIHVDPGQIRDEVEAAWGRGLEEVLAAQ